MAAPELVATAHRSLGYLTSPISSPQDDSIRAAWRSSSAAALTDIPEFPTPSPERPSPRRMRSAPDILKVSPPTPISSYLVRRPPLQTAERLRNAMFGDEGSLGCGGVRTPITSPVRKGGLGSPLRDSGSNKRQRVDQGDLPISSPPRLIFLEINQPRTPNTSPLLPYSHQAFSNALASTCSHIASHRISPSPAHPVMWAAPSINTHLIASKGELPKAVRRRGRLKPLSLRSRIRLAARKSLVRAAPRSSSMGGAVP